MIQVFYHENDLDGWASGALVRYYYKFILKTKDDDIWMTPYDYHKEEYLHRLIDYNADYIYFVDCSADPATLEEIDKHYGKVVIIDHHKSLIEKIQKNGYSFSGNQRSGIAGCQLVWDTLFGGKRPEIIDLLGTYDIWDNRDEQYWKSEVMPFQMAMKMEAQQPDSREGKAFWDKIIEKSIYGHDDHFINEMLDKGITIIRYQENEDEKIIKANSFEAKLEGYRAICVNNPRKNSQLFKSIWDENKYDIMIVWHDVGGIKDVISLYTTKDDIDVSQIAKKYGGGGHRQAAGFIVGDSKVEGGKFCIRK
jgi:oligoribonuclease NrnB/cAMP/cGMP phosphodiesterase (DHH superfamily)